MAKNPNDDTEPRVQRRVNTARNNTFLVTRLLKIYFSILVASALSLAALPAAASVGHLVRGASGAIYYVTNGQRYVFPNSAVFLSWYPDFSGVFQVRDSDLASLPLVGNVTYRPGVRLVKVQTDPKVYAIDSGETLRWVTSEDVAKELFGLRWNKLIDDIPDVFMADYAIGAPITSQGDYSRLSVMADSSEPDQYFRDRNAERQKKADEQAANRNALTACNVEAKSLSASLEKAKQKQDDFLKTWSGETVENWIEKTGTLPVGKEAEEADFSCSGDEVACYESFYGTPAQEAFEKWKSVQQKALGDAVASAQHSYDNKNAECTQIGWQLSKP